MNRITLVSILLVLAACQQQAGNAPASAPAPEPAAAAPSAAEHLAAILAAQPDDVRARYAYRHPAETLAFFGIEPGMVVVEALPGSGWYTKLLLPYLGAEGHLIGVNYAMDIWPNFPFADDAFIEQQRTWTTDFVAGAEAWRGDNGATVSAADFGSIPESMTGTADAVLFIRILHNLARFDSKGGFLGEAFDDAYRLLRPGGTLGIVQHEAREDKSDAFADGSHGYLKKAFVIAAAEAAGFVFVAESDVNENPADQPGDNDVVWRLPPTLGGTEEGSDARSAVEAIGESHRMTLRFKKPE